MVARPLEWFEKDYYRLLGVTPDASPQEIIRAFRTLARSCHPDAMPGDRRAEEQFKELSAAFNVLRDGARRAEYDVVRRSVAAATAWPSAPNPGAEGLRVGPDRWDVLGSRSDNPPGARGAARPGPEREAAPEPRAGDQLERTVRLSRDDARRGCLTVVEAIDDVPCPDCDGHGAAPNGTVQRCPTCAGRGTLPHDYGGFSLTASCPACFGSGRIVDQPCRRCHGAGVAGQHRQVRVRVPAGVTQGQRLRVPGQGGPGRRGGPPGDLYLTIRLHPPPPGDN
jgi:molecular chaperone DnaJ